MNTKKMAYAAMMTALTFVATYAVRIPIPFTTGYIHLGDCMVFLSALFLGGGYGALAAGLGSMLADVIGGYFQWALPTLLIKAMMALFIGLAVSIKTKKGKVIYPVAIIILWTTFTVMVKEILTKGSKIHGLSLVESLDGVSSQMELQNLVSSVQRGLNIAAVLVIVIVIGISIYNYKNNLQMDLMFSIGMVASGLWMVVGYYVTEYILYGNHIVPVLSIPWNLIQFTAGIVLASILYIPLQRVIGKML